MKLAPMFQEFIEGTEAIRKSAGEANECYLDRHFDDAQDPMDLVIEDLKTLLKHADYVKGQLCKARITPVRQFNEINAKYRS